MIYCSKEWIWTNLENLGMEWQRVRADDSFYFPWKLIWQTSVSPFFAIRPIWSRSTKRNFLPKDVLEENIIEHFPLSYLNLVPGKYKLSTRYWNGKGIVINVIVLMWSLQQSRAQMERSSLVWSGRASLTKHPPNYVCWKTKDK